MPGSLEAVQNPAGLPPSLLQKMRIVRNNGGTKVLSDHIHALRQRHAAALARLEKAEETLRQEEDSDRKLRQQYGVDWNRTPSHALTQMSVSTLFQKCTTHVKVF